MWSPDGKELFYRSGNKLTSVRITTQPSFAFSNPVALPIEGFVQPDAGGARNYDITPDGKQSIVVLPAEQTQSDRFGSSQILIVNR